jgi:hypothetical protein
MSNTDPTKSRGSNTDPTKSRGSNTDPTKSRGRGEKKSLKIPKGPTRIRYSKNRQHNDQTKKDK